MPTTAESVAAAFGLLWFWSAGRAIEECDSATTIEATQITTPTRKVIPSSPGSAPADVRGLREVAC